MNKAKRKNTPKPPQRQSGKARTKGSPADPSIALGLQYFAASAAYNQTHDHLDNIDCPPGAPEPTEKPSTCERIAVAIIRIANERGRRKDETDRLCERANAMLTLRLQEPATSVCERGTLIFPSN